MRPSDENQHRSKRPNLFSAANRPSGDEENILARLERGAAPAPAYQPEGRARMLLLGGAALSILTLLGVLGLIINGSGSAPAAIPMEVAARPSPPPAAPLQNATASAAPAAMVVDQFDHLTELAPSLVTLAPPAPVQALAQPLRSVPVRQVFKRPAPAPAVKAHQAAPKPEPALDSEVALLAAILAQSPRHTPANSHP